MIIPSFNYAAFIEQAVKSVWGQAYLNIELIVIDDGSSDTSLAILNDLLAQSPILMRVEVHLFNQGIAATLNHGIKLATGDYISFCGADDWLDPDCVLHQVVLLDQYPEYGMVHTGRMQVRGARQKPYIISQFKDPTRFFETLFLQQGCVCASSVMVRRSVFDVVGVFDESLSVEDRDMWLRIGDRYPVGYIAAPLVYYRTHGQNFHLRYPHKMTSSKVAVFQKWMHSPFYAQAILNETFLKDTLGVLRRQPILQWAKLPWGLRGRTLFSCLRSGFINYLCS